jgi:hypothetical protein
MTAAFASLSAGRVLQYHNVTPAHFLRHTTRRCSGWRPSRAKSWRRSRSTDLALGDSEYNRHELEELGFGRTGVMPIAVDTERLTEGAPHPVLDDDPRRRVRELSLRRPDRAEQE